MLANNDTVEALLGEYPHLTREDILACLDYAAALTEEQVTPIQIAGDRRMDILVDENIPLMTVAALRDAGHNVKDVRGSVQQGLSDTSVG